MKAESARAPVPSDGVRAVGVLVVRDGRVLLGKRRGSHGAGTWAAPGGRMEYGETIQACARRELAEETGLTFESCTIASHTNDVFADLGQHYVTFLVLTRDAAGEPVNREPAKCEGWSWHDWQQLPQPLFLPLQNLIDQGFVIER